MVNLNFSFCSIVFPIIFLRNTGALRNQYQRCKGQGYLPHWNNIIIYLFIGEAMKVFLPDDEWLDMGK